MDVTVEILELLMNGFSITISLIKLALLIKLMDIKTELDVLPKLNARTVCLGKGAGHNKELKFTLLKNMEKFQESKI